jgi:hypothetical protein
MVEAGGKESSGELVGMKERVARMGGGGEVMHGIHGIEEATTKTAAAPSTTEFTECAHLCAQDDASLPEWRAVWERARV